MDRNPRNLSSRSTDIHQRNWTGSRTGFTTQSPAGVISRTILRKGKKSLTGIPKICSHSGTYSGFIPFPPPTIGLDPATSASSPGNPRYRSRNCPLRPRGFSPTPPRRNPASHTKRNRSPSRGRGISAGDTCTDRASSDTASASSEREGKDNNRGSRDILDEAWEASSACADGGSRDDAQDAGGIPVGDNPAPDTAHPTGRDNGGESPRDSANTGDFPARGPCRKTPRALETDSDTESPSSAALDDVSAAPPPVRPPVSAARRAPAPWGCAPSCPPPGNPIPTNRWPPAISRRKCRIARPRFQWSLPVARYEFSRLAPLHKKR